MWKQHSYENPSFSFECYSVNQFLFWIHSRSFINNLTIIITINNLTTTTMTHNTTNYAIPDQLLVSLLKAWLCECRFCVFFSRCCAFIPTRAFSACATYSRWLRHKVTTAGRFVASASLWWWIHKPLLFANLWKVLKERRWSQNGMPVGVDQLAMQKQ